MIKSVTLFKSNKGTIKHRVHYEDRVRTFYDNQCLPKTVVIFLMNSKNVTKMVTETGTITFFR